MNTYLLFKSLHLIAVISWMAGLLYLPRIFVYHSQNNDKPLVSEVFKGMERKLFFYIMTPAMTLSWISGVFGHNLIPLGVNDFGQTGTSADLYEKHNIDSNSIIKSVNS